MTDEMGWKVNMFEDEWKSSRKTELSDMKEHWVPEEIIYADGTTITAPDSN